MTREEAIKELRCFIGQLTEGCQEVIKVLIPELGESEDEKVRKSLLAYIKGESKRLDTGKWIAYLEKQKELPFVKDVVLGSPGLYFYDGERMHFRGEEVKQKENPKSADFIPADCTSLAKCEDRDSKYGVFPEDVLVVARACEKLEAHGYPELAYALKNVNLYTKPVDYDHEMWKNCEANFEGGKKEVIDHPEKYGLQKEQKPLPHFDELTPEEKMNHPLYLEGFDVGRAVQKVFDAQNQPEVDLEEEYKTWWKSISGKINVEHIMEWYMHETARHFYELGLKAKEE